MLARAVISFVLLLTVVWLSDHATAQGARVISSEATSRYVDLALGKVVAIELPKDASHVVVGDPKKVIVQMRTARRAYVIGNGSGRTSAYFFDDDDHVIAALDITVTTLTHVPPPPMPGATIPIDPMVMYNGADQPAFLYCTSHTCVFPGQVETEEKPNTTHSDITIHGGGGSNNVLVPAK